MLKPRLLFSLGILPVVIAAVWFGGSWFTAFAVIWGFMAAFEFFRLSSINKLAPITWFGLLGTVVLMLHPYYSNEFNLSLILTSIIVIPLVFLLLRRNKENAFTGWVWTVAGILYIGWLLSFWIELRCCLDYRNWVFLGLFVTFVSDSSAYLVGRKWGKHYLAPRVSPKKTWEGAVAGVAAAVCLSLCFIVPSPLSLSVTWWQVAVLGLLISIFGQLGDLAKSLFKRNMGVKDSSNFIPGHGGFLDRIDSIVFAGVVLYYYVVWILPHL